MLVRLRKNTLLEKHCNFPPSNRYNHLVKYNLHLVFGDITKLLETLKYFNIQLVCRNTNKEQCVVTLVL